MNILKYKPVKRIEWKVKLPSNKDSQIVSETFLFQNKNCYLEFYTGDSYHGNWNYLSFQCHGELQLPIKVTLCVLEDLKNYDPLVISIESASQNIWVNNNSCELLNHHMTFQLIFHSDYSTGDKAVQTPPYIDSNVQLEAVTKDFSNLFDAGSKHDVEFLCGDETIKAHKNVICCRSTVFATMLGTDMQEGKTGQIKIHDMDSSILNQFLRYLYTGVFPESTSDTILRIYEAADKYAVDSLKEQCACFLIDNLSHENACEVLILSDRHNDSNLKKVVLEYVLKEKIPLLMGEKWEDFCKENPTLAIELLNKYYRNSSGLYH